MAGALGMVLHHAEHPSSRQRTRHPATHSTASLGRGGPPGPSRQPPPVPARLAPYPGAMPHCTAWRSGDVVCLTATAGRCAGLALLCSRHVSADGSRRGSRPLQCAGHRRAGLRQLQAPALGAVVEPARANAPTGKTACGRVRVAVFHGFNDPGSGRLEGHGTCGSAWP